MSDADTTGLRERIKAAMATWPPHDVVSCTSYVCPDCAVQSCRDDIETALSREQP